MSQADEGHQPPPPPPSSSLPWAVQVSSILALVLLWPVAFLARTLLALYLPRARIWFALAVAAVSVVLYGFRMMSSAKWLDLGTQQPIQQIVVVALLDSLQNLSLMIGSGCVPAPVSCLVPLTHVQLKRRPDSYAAAALTAAGFVILVVVTREHVRPGAMILICTSPLFMALSTSRRIALLDAAVVPDSFTLQLLSSLLQIPLWVVLYPVTSQVQAVVLPLETRFHPVFTALFVQHDAAYIAIIGAVILLLVVNFVVVWSLRMRPGAAVAADADDGFRALMQYASRGADLVTAPSASPQQVEIAMIAGATIAFLLSGVMVPQRSHLIWLSVGAALILSACAIQVQSRFRMKQRSPPAPAEYELPLVS